MRHALAACISCLPLLLPSVARAADSAPPASERGVATTAEERKFLNCMRAIHRIEGIALSPEHEALMLAGERDRRAESQFSQRIFAQLDSKEAQKIRAESAAASFRKYGCVP